VVGTDVQSDLAVIKVDPTGLTLDPVSLGDSQAVKVGDLVIAIGNPYGLAGSMTQGIVSALSRSLTVDSSNPFSSSSYTIPDIIQTDAAVNPGNSGGVLVKYFWRSHRGNFGDTVHHERQLPASPSPSPPTLWSALCRC